jgi:hypothetical protein
MTNVKKEKTSCVVNRLLKNNNGSVWARIVLQLFSGPRAIQICPGKVPHAAQDPAECSHFVNAPFIISALKQRCHEQPL